MTEAKYNNRKNNNRPFVISKSGYLYRSDYITDYEKNKEEQHKNVLKEIKRYFSIINNL